MTKNSNNKRPRKGNKSSRRSQNRNSVSSIPHAHTRPVQRVELKYNTLAAALYAYDTTGSVTLLNGIAEGVENTQRIGRHAVLKHVRIRGIVAPQGSANATNTLCRTLLVYDAQPNAALPAINLILDSATAVASYNVDYFDRFKILHDSQVAMGFIQTTATQTYSTSPTVHSFNIDVPVNLETRFILTTGVIGAIESGSLLLVTVGVNAAGTNYTLYAATQVMFSDQ